MSNLWFQSDYTDTDSRWRFVTTAQAPGDRVVDTLDDHSADLASTLSSHPKGSGSVPGPAVPNEADSPKVSSYIGADGIRHTTMTTQKPGESEADWQARHDAAHAALQAEYPPAS
jgi:hypothetical protein